MLGGTSFHGAQALLFTSTRNAIVSSIPAIQPPLVCQHAWEALFSAHFYSSVSSAEQTSSMKTAWLIRATWSWKRRKKLAFLAGTWSRNSFISPLHGFCIASIPDPFLQQFKAFRAILAFLMEKLKRKHTGDLEGAWINHIACLYSIGSYWKQTENRLIYVESAISRRRETCFIKSQLQYILLHFLYWIKCDYKASRTRCGGANPWWALEHIAHNCHQKKAMPCGNVTARWENPELTESINGIKKW